MSQYAELKRVIREAERIRQASWVDAPLSEGGPHYTKGIRMALQEVETDDETLLLAHILVNGEILYATLEFAGRE